MRKNIRLITGAASALAIAGAVAFFSNIAIAEGDKKAASDEHKEGKALAFDRKKGNCLACHIIKGGEMAGNIAPPLMMMKARFPKKKDMKAKIVDPRITKPNTIMPPFGAHSVMSDSEIDKVVDFIYSL
ncbi:MAG: sulfur oxidation c-type cytochrome SoxX [Thiotrichaceae bacterium]|nr:sulfur oxidation c-type cytochrome SoxX [Thiotrichaceae bacterium]